MEIFISENLKRLRAERGLRQEDLANHIGISVQSVSKWERGETLPDTALLPYIAEFYSVTVDELLGVGEMRRAAEIKKFKAEFDSLGEKKEYVAQMKLAKGIYADYPNDITVMRCMMDTLRQNGCFEESLKFTERLLSAGTDSNARYEAIRSGAFCARYAPCRTEEQARRNAEMAERYALMLPNYYETINQVLVGINPSTALAAANIESLMHCLYGNILVLQSDDVREKIALWKKAAGLVEYVCEGCFGSMSDILLRLYLFIAHDSAIIGDDAAALEYLQRGARIAAMCDEHPRGTYTSPLLGGGEYVCSGKARAALRCQMERWAGFARIKACPEFRAIMDSLGEYEETNEDLMRGEMFAYKIVNLAALECRAYSGAADICGIGPASAADCVPCLKNLFTGLPNCHAAEFDEEFISELNTKENELFALREEGKITAVGVVNKASDVWEIALLSGLSSSEDPDWSRMERMLAYCTKYITDSGHTARLRISVLNTIIIFAEDMGYERAE